MPTPSETELAGLRREVDRIDRAVVELLAERLHVVRAIAALKRQETDGRPAIRPGREAAILRRLVAQAGGRFPTATLVRMWRELLAATTRAQAPLAVAACVPPGREALWDLARDHFGAIAPLRRIAHSAAALRLVREGEADLVVLPVPGTGESWWVDLAATGLRVVAALPFVGSGIDALVVGAFPPDPSGDDLTLLSVATADDLTEDRLGELLRAVGLVPRQLDAVPAGERRLLRLVELEGFFAAGDERVAALVEPGRLVLRCTWLGGYARPLAVGD
ncbi:MAG: chorismate mutase [Geminicoccaceae bacterium]